MNEICLCVLFHEDKEQEIFFATAPKLETLLFTTPSSRYESIVSENTSNRLQKSQYFDIDRKASFGNTSDSDGVQSNGVSISRSFL